VRTPSLARTAAAVLCLAACGIVAAAVPAADYPTRPIRFIVPFPPGGGTDIYARIIGPKLAEALRQQVVVDNRAGAAGALGAEVAAKAPADGYTIWIGQTSNLVIVPALRAKLGYDPVRDFAPITLISKAPSAMVVNADSPIASIKDLVAAARSSPGKLTYATAGVGSSSHIAGEMFKQTAGIDVTHVPYKGASPAMMDLRGGRVTYMGTSLASAAQFVKEGKIRAIATTGAKRARMLPDVPTVAEQGYPGFESVSWLGMLAPARVPRAIIDRLNREIVSLLQTPEVQKLVLAEGGETVPGTPEEFAAFLKSELPKWAQVIKRAGITAD
jgi:tripartite-type tricarboxylate transporter receptor subunit TctC